MQDMYRRLEFISRRLDSLGLRHQANNLEMLQRMVGDQSVAPLKMFADLVKPTSLGIRRKIREYSSLTPLNRMVDAVLPESEAARQFENAVNGALDNPSGLPEAFQPIRKQLTIWHDNARGLKPILEQSFLLQEIGPLSEMIADLSLRGLEALDYLGKRQNPQDAWREETALLIGRAEKPQAEMLIAIVAPIRKLLEATAALP
jgi:hexosaminidase